MGEPDFMGERTVHTEEQNSAGAHGGRWLEVGDRKGQASLSF